MINDAEFATTGRSERPVVAELFINASAKDVFDSWTDSDRVSAWLGIPSHIELRVGGPFEFYFMADGPKGTRGSEGCKILGYVPDELLVVSWNSPPTLPVIRDAKTQVGIALTKGEGGTHVRLVHTGMGEGPSWDKNREYFSNAWPNVLHALKANLEG